MIYNIIITQACPLFSVSAIWPFLDENKYWLVSILLCLGIVECFIGYYYFKATIFITSYLFVFIVLMVILLINL